VSAFGSRRCWCATLRAVGLALHLWTVMPLSIPIGIYTVGARSDRWAVRRWLPPPDHRHATFARGCVAPGRCLLAGRNVVDRRYPAVNFFSPRRYFPPSGCRPRWFFMGRLAAHLWSMRAIRFGPRRLWPVVFLLSVLVVFSRLTRVGGQHSRLSFVNPDSGGATGASLLGQHSW